MTEVNPADMWAYATRPIAEADPNEPLLAVTRAADAAEPRVVRASHGAMVDGRFEVPGQRKTCIDTTSGSPVEVTTEVVPKRRAEQIADAKQRTRRDVAAIIT